MTRLGGAYKRPGWGCYRFSAMARIQGWWWRYPTMAIQVVIGLLVVVAVPAALIAGGAGDLIDHPHRYIRDGAAIIVGLAWIAVVKLRARRHPIRDDRSANGLGPFGRWRPTRRRPVWEHLLRI